MSKMKTLDLLLKEYDEALNAYGYADPMVKALYDELMTYGMDDVYDLVCGIEMEFDMMVFNNQTEGRF